MRSFPNSASVLTLAALLLAGAAAAQDGSGIPRDPSQAAPTRKPPDRTPSLSVPLAPEGTIGNPSSPAGPDQILPSELPPATQDGDFAEQGDGAVDPDLPSVLSGPTDATPADLPVGEVAPTPSRAQVLEQAQGYTIDPGAVETKPIDAVDPSATGTLEAAEGGLGDDLWLDADYATIAELMDQIPVATNSPAMNALIRRVLLTGAKPKEAPSSGPTLFDIRTARLAEAGLTGDLIALVDAQGGGAGDAGARADAMLLGGRPAEACSAKEDDTDAAAIERRAACQIAAGDTAAAALSADLARVKGADDPAFFALVAHLAEGAPLDAAKLTHLTPTTYALAVLAKAKLTEPALEGAAPGVLVALATNEALSANLRLAAGERAAAVGALDADSFTALLRRAKPGKSGVAAAAALVQAAYDNEGLEARAKAITAAMSAADARGLGALYARIVGPAAWDSAPAREAAAYADGLTRALFLSGRADRAADWLNVMDEVSLGRAALDELTVRLALGAPSGQSVAAAHDALTRMAEAAPYDEAKALRTIIYAGALDAMGFEIPPAAQSLLTNSPLMAAQPVGAVETAEMAEAARGGRKGEAILRALIALGPGGPAQAHPATVIEVVAALSGAGLSADAVAIALEAALARPVGGGG